MLHLTKTEQTELTIEIAAVASVKGGKIVKNQMEVLREVWNLVCQEVEHIGNEDGSTNRTAHGLNYNVVTFLSDVRSKRVREFNANDMRYVAAVVQRLKGDER
jgi:hypothetical protein